MNSWLLFFINRERYLFAAIFVLICLMNFSTGRYVLYPFKIFSTWVHEMCHGMAAILSGGYCAKLEIFPDGSGLATTASQHRGFVASAGYAGTSVTGGLLLLFRRRRDLLSPPPRPPPSHPRRPLCRSRAHATSNDRKSNVDSTTARSEVQLPETAKPSTC